MPQTKTKPKDTAEARADRKREAEKAKVEKALAPEQPPAPPPEQTSKVTKAQKDQAKLADANRDRWLSYDYVESHGAVPSDNGDKQIDVHAVGGKVYINTHGERTLDRDEVVTLRKALDAAWVTVQ